jgi:putative pyruvate formate lyase activating enzyme
MSRSSADHGRMAVVMTFSASTPSPALKRGGLKSCQYSVTVVQSHKRRCGDMNRPLTDRLAKCECCPRKCGVNRLGGQAGVCRIRARIEIAHAGLHFGEEPPISGTNGSGAIFFAGCNLRCVFCQNYQISQEFQQSHIRTLTIDELASEMLRLQAEGAHNINFVSPSHMIFQMADAIRVARGKGLLVPVVYNSNGYDSVEALQQVRGLVDIYLPDLKYADNALGKQFSGVRDYAEIVPGALREMLDQVGHLEMDDEGIAVRGLLVRHLVLPGYLDNSRSCLRALADLSPDTFVSLMSQYSPQYKAGDFPRINRTLTEDEYDDIVDYALDLGLENAFTQELESQGHYLPDFAQASPFNSAASNLTSPILELTIRE